MREEFFKHYKTVEQDAKKRLREFEKLKRATDDELFEELAFCTFAANSSAEMGLLAVKYLKPVLKTGTLDDYKNSVHKKVRFYNKRSEYLHYNKLKLEELGIKLEDVISEKDKHKKRLFVKENFKGFGLKEASHFLRNTGTKGLCIIDKHVMRVMKEINVIEKNTIIKKDEDYYEIEQKIILFAKENKLDIDILDLAAWSYVTGKIIK